MEQRTYYSTRNGKLPQKLDLELAKRLFMARYRAMCHDGCFMEVFGYECVDAGSVSGLAGPEPEMFLFARLRKPGLWPIQERWKDYTEDDFFDVLEFLHDFVSEPDRESGYFHSYMGCGWHPGNFAKPKAQAMFRGEVNAILRDYDTGFELAESGEILALGDPGLTNLLEANLPYCDQENVKARVEQAISKYRRHRSRLDQRFQAVRDLADVLEFCDPTSRPCSRGRTRATSSRSQTTSGSGTTGRTRRRTSRSLSGTPGCSITTSPPSMPVST